MPAPSMPSSNPHVPNQLRSLIYYQLDNLLLQNALFLAGRLHAYEPRAAESSHLLALCYLRLGQLKPAYDHSKAHASKGSHLGCSYVFAEACRLLDSHKEKEGISALERSRGLWGERSNWNKHNETSRRHLPDAAAVYSLLGKLWHRHGDLNKAVGCYEEALKLNPFMWDAFEGLCGTGAEIRISSTFKMTPEMAATLSLTSSREPFSNHASIAEEPTANGPLQSQRNKGHGNQQPSYSDVFGGSSGRLHPDGSSASGGSGLFQKLNESISTNIVSSTGFGGGGSLGFESVETPTNSGGGIESRTAVASGLVGGDVAIPGASEAPHAPIRKPRVLRGIGMDIEAEAPPRMRSTSFKRPAKVGSETDDSIEGTTRRPISFASSTVGGERKRTITGQPTLQSTSEAEEPAGPAQRRSGRLLSQMRPGTAKLSSSMSSIGLRDGKDLKKARATGTKGRLTTTTSTVGRVISGNRKATEVADPDAKEGPSTVIAGGLGGVQKSVITEASKQQEALQWLLSIFRTLGGGFYALTHYRCQEALRVFTSIPSAQRETPWVLAQIGRAYYEQASYADAEKYFRKIRTQSHTRLDDMEVYSTILWHLKNEVELSYLAHELMDIDRLSPQAWCAVGNTFSLQRDHDQALKCFKRATQLQPKFAYAFTLQGHEHVSNEEYDKALNAYRSGITADGRHYNAWYGLGKVYEKMGKYDVAEKHYRTAAGINPTNAVLICCIGMVLEKLKNPRAALVQYAEACNIAPRSTLSRFKKARVLMALQEPHLALSELNILKDIAPDEANVHFLLGKLYKTLRQKANAIKHFTIALNLDPKAGQYIKEAIESLEDEDEGEDDGVMA